MTEVYNTPLAGINLGNLRIHWQKTKKMDMFIDLFGETLQISKF